MASEVRVEFHFAATVVPAGGRKARKTAENDLNQLLAEVSDYAGKRGARIVMDAAAKEVGGERE
jgi:hypothetical protein